MTTDLDIGRHRNLAELKRGLQQFKKIAGQCNAPMLAYLIGMAELQAGTDAAEEGRRRRELREQVAIHATSSTKLDDDQL